MTVLMLLSILAAVDLTGLIKGLIFLLLAAGLVALVCYIVTRLLATFLPGAASWGWIIWCIGGLVVLLIALQIFLPALGV